MKTVIFALLLIVPVCGLALPSLSPAATVFVDAALGADQVGCGTSAGAGACQTIQYALDNETGTGDTVRLAAGTYTENVVMDKRVILEGAGSGGDPGVDTIIHSAAANTNVIRLTAGGTSAAERMILRDLRVTGGSGGPNNGNGITMYNMAGGVYTTYENVTSTGNDGNGIAFDVGGSVTLFDVVVSSCDLSNNPGGTGFRVPTSVSLDGLTIAGTNMDGNGVIGLSMYGPVTNLDISNSTFSNNGLVGIYGYVERDFPVKKGVVMEGVTANGNGRGIALRIYGGSVAISNSTASGNNNVNPGDIGQGLDLSVRDVDTSVTLSNVTAEDNEDVNIFLETKYGATIADASFDGVTVTGSNDEPASLFCDGCGIWLHTLGTEAMSNVTITNSTVTGNNRGIVLEAGTAAITGVSIVGNDIRENGTASGIVISEDAAAGNEAYYNIIAGNGVGVENGDVDDVFSAGENWWGDNTGPYNALANPDGLGDEVSDNVVCEPWQVLRRPAMRKPARGEVRGRRRVTFRWKTRGEAGGYLYRIKVWKRGQWKNKLVNEVLTGTKYTAKFKKGFTYRWKVRAGVGFGLWGPWSEPRTFKVM